MARYGATWPVMDFSSLQLLVAGASMIFFEQGLILGAINPDTTSLSSPIVTGLYQV